MIDHAALYRAANELEPLPASVTRLAAIVARDSWSLGEVAGVIQVDQALTARLLRHANSAASASYMRVGTVVEAIVRLGVGSVLSLAVSTAVRGRISHPIPEYGLAEGELWRHSAAAALAAEASIGLSRAPVPAESVAAALLHDVGKVVLARFLAPDLLRLLDLARRQGRLPALQAEIEILGSHHGEIGGLIAEHWRLPPRMVHAIIHHHTPEQAEDPACDAVHVANVVAKRIGAGAAASAEELAPATSALERLGLDEAALERLCTRTSERLEAVLAPDEDRPAASR